MGLSNVRCQAGCIPRRKRVQGAIGAFVFRAASRPSIYCGEAATTTLGAAGAVKPKNPKNPKNLRPARAVNPHAEGVSKGRHHNPLNPPAESGQNLLNLLNPGRRAALFISTV